MLSSEAAGLAIKIAKGLIKVTSRIDVILAEKEAVKGPLALPIAEVGLSPTQPRMRRALRRLLSATDGTYPYPLGTDRDEMLDTVENNPEKRALLFEFMQRYLPEQALGRQLDLNSDFLTALREARPDLASDPDLRIKAFYISSGEDHRNKDYSWRITLTSEVANTMLRDLERYVQYCSSDDRQWVIDNPNSNVMEGEVLMADFRNRVWLREMIRSFKTTAQELELPSSLAWKPDWVAELELD